MKLVRFSTNGQSPRLGILDGERIVDVQGSVAATLAKRGVARAQEIAEALVPQSTRRFLEGGVASQDAVAGISEWVTVSRGAGIWYSPVICIVSVSPVRTAS